MLVIHISFTPLAGAPIRIVQALNQYTDYDVRLINFNPSAYGTRTFPEDLIWEKDKDECLELLSKADIIHAYHFFDFENDNGPFGFNLKQFVKKDCKFVRQFESSLDFVSRCGFTKEKIINDKYPKIVIPHYPERTFLDAFVVPNIIPINDKILLPKHNENDAVEVFFSASDSNSMWDYRWDAKGLPEVFAKFNSLKTEAKFNLSVIQNTPYEECQKLKQNSDIVIGDTTTGSYHLTDLEALAMGKPTFTYLDGRTQMVLQTLLGCADLPFVNTRLEEIDLPFIELVNNKKLRTEIGNFSRNWIEKYYNEQKLVKIYEDVYEKLLNDEPIHRQNYLKFKQAKTFLYNNLYDLQWETRKNKNKKKNNFIAKLLKRLKTKNKT